MKKNIAALVLAFLTLAASAFADGQIYRISLKGKNPISYGMCKDFYLSALSDEHLVRPGNLLVKAACVPVDKKDSYGDQHLKLDIVVLDVNLASQPVKHWTTTVTSNKATGGFCGEYMATINGLSASPKSLVKKGFLLQATCKDAGTGDSNPERVGLRIDLFPEAELHCKK